MNSAILYIRTHLRRATVVAVLLLPASGVFPQQPAGGGGGGTNPANPTPYESRWAYNLFPLARGNQWRYEIRRKGVKVGNLEIRVLSERREKKSDYQYINYYRLQYIDTFRNKRYRRMVATTPDIFIENPRNGKYYPFMKRVLKLGWRLYGMLVVDISSKKLEGRRHVTATLKHLKKDREEVYMSQIGLYSIREGDISYKLTKAMVRRQR